MGFLSCTWSSDLACQLSAGPNYTLQHITQMDPFSLLIQGQQWSWEQTLALFGTLHQAFCHVSAKSLLWVNRECFSSWRSQPLTHEGLSLLLDGLQLCLSRRKKREFHFPSITPASRDALIQRQMMNFPNLAQGSQIWPIGLVFLSVTLLTLDILTLPPNP